VIVRNNGSPEITMITIRWASPDTELSVGGFSFGPSFPLNGLVLMSPNGGSRVLQHNGDKPQAEGRGMGMRVSQIAQRYSGLDITVSLDLVVFKDHGYIGPNKAGMVEREDREYKATRTLAAELKAMPSQDRAAFLEAIQNSEATDSDSWDARTAALRIGEYRPMPEDEFQRWMDRIIDESAPLRRRQ
jgi:hypothetical protein